MRRCGQQDHQRDLHRSGRAAADRTTTPCRTSRPSSRRPASRVVRQRELHLERHAQQRTSTSSTSASITRSAADTISCSAATAYMNTHREEPPALDDPIASGDFASDIAQPRARASWSAGRSVFGNVAVQRVPRLVEQGRLRCRAPAFGIDVNARYGITGVPNDPRFTAAFRTCRSRGSPASAARSSGRSSRHRRSTSSPTT